MNPWIQVTGWALIHSVWQAALIAAAAAAALALSRRRSPEVRYAIACAALAAMLAAPAATGALIAGGGFVLAPPADPPRTGAAATAPQGRVLRITPLPLATSGNYPAPSLDRLLPALVYGWVAGVVLLMGRLAGGYWRIRRLRHAGTGQAASRWQPNAQALADRMGLTVAFRVVESTLVRTPAALGWLRPTILLPVAAFSGLSPMQVEALLAHELAHIRRRDYAINLLQTLAESLLFFHPAVWWISARIREEREHCCDDAAVAACGEPRAYAEALAEIATWRAGHPALSLGATSGGLVRRIRRLLDAPGQPAANSGAPGLFAAAVVLASLAAAAIAPSLRAQGAPSQGGTAASAVHRTDHFEIHHGPALDLHAQRIGREAERAYEQVSGDLRHNLAFTVPIVLVGTRNEMERASGASTPAHHGSFIDPPRNRIVIAVDQPPDQWLGLLTHEVTHVFTFDIIPGTETPRWITEGLAEYQRGAWDPADLVALRDIVRAGSIPTITRLEWREGGTAARLPYAVAHAAFDFIESRFGKAGVRQFLFALRQAASGGGDPFQVAFRMSAEDFDAAVVSYLRERFPAAAQAAARVRFDDQASVRIEGEVTATRLPVRSGLACIELWVGSMDAGPRRWAIECDEARGHDFVASIRPGDRIVVTGAPARPPGAQRLAIRSLVRASDGFAWGPGVGQASRLPAVENLVGQRLAAFERADVRQGRIGDVRQRLARQKPLV